MDNRIVLVIAVILLIAFIVMLRVIPNLKIKKSAKYVITVLIIITICGGILFKFGLNPVSLFNFGEKYTKEDVEKFLSKNFELQTIEKWWKFKKFQEPIIGRSSFIASFKDKSGNDCSMIADRFLNEYIVIYNNLVVEDNKEELSRRYKGFIDTTIQTYNNGMGGCTGSLVLQDINVKKVKCNTGLFKNGLMCQISFKGIYREISNPSEIYEISRVIFYDFETKRYWDEDKKFILD